MSKNCKVAYISPEECSLVPEDWEWLEPAKTVKKCSWDYTDLNNFDFVLVMGSLAHKYINSGLKFQQAKGCLIRQKFYVTITEGEAMFRGKKKLPLLKEHIKAFKKLIKGESTQNKVNHRIVLTEEDEEDMFFDIIRSKAVAIDTETSGLNPFVPDKFMASIGIATKNNAWCIPLDHLDDENNVHYGKHKWQRRLIKKIAKFINGKKRIIGHNFKFDTLWIYQCYKVWIDFTDDTMLMHYNLDENTQHGLKLLSARFLGNDIYDIPEKEKNGYGGLVSHCAYLAQDIRYTYDLYKVFKPMLEEDPLSLRVYNEITIPAVKAFARAENNGTWINPKTLEEATSYWSKIAQETSDKLKSYGDINWNSPKQAAEILFKKLKLPILDKTPTGTPSMSESVLLRLKDKHEVPQLLLDNRKATKFISTFLDPWKKLTEQSGDQRIHPTFKVHGTVTGRPACESPNLQQVPRDPSIRSIIDAPEGWDLIEADLSQAELRIAAEMSQDRELRNCYLTGIDVHKRTVESIFGIDPKEMTKEQRKKGKAINFGFIYGMGWKKFMDYARDNYGQVFTEKESQNTRKGYFRLYQDLPEWHKRQRNFVRKYGYVRNLIGRKRRLEDALLPDNSDNRMAIAQAERNSINSPVQSLASDINLNAFIDICNKYSNNIVRPCGTIHDAIMLEVKKEYTDQVSKDLKEMMENPSIFKRHHVQFNIPIESEVEIGPWSKGEVWKEKEK